MRTLIIYFSKTGNSQQVARRMAERLSADLQEILCDQYLGSAGDLWAGFDNIIGRTPKLVPINDLNEYDRIIIGGPIWLGRPSAPIRAAAEQYAKGRVDCGIFVCGMGPEDLDSAAKQLAALFDHKPAAVFKTHGSMLGSAEFENELDRFCGEFTNQLETTKHA